MELRQVSRFGENKPLGLPPGAPPALLPDPYGVVPTMLVALACAGAIFAASQFAAIFLGIDIAVTETDVASRREFVSAMRERIAMGNIVMNLMQFMFLVPLLVGLAYFRQMTPLQYFGHGAVTWKRLLLCVAIAGFLRLGLDGIAYATGHPVASDNHLLQVKNLTVLPMLVLAMIVAAPVSEGILYHGFLFRGIEARLGGVMAVILSSLFYAVNYLSTGFYGAVQWLIVATVIGLVRWWSGSILLAILIQMLVTLALYAEAIYIVHVLPG